ncbi:hypothetical protein ABZ725_42725 [Streptomyces sp. NPDC006872]|uniref:hypothetical protein n=1 Tax=Streptomyces sp. NPDC006872 TaxID=3155720 RepID=UPI0034028D8A
MGNPHAVVLVDAGDLSPPPAAEPAGAYLSPTASPPSSSTVLGLGHLALRVHERGVGETAPAALVPAPAVAAHRRRAGRTETADYRVDLPGGYLHVSVAVDGAMALTGSAVITTVGTIRLSHAGDTTS